MADKFLNLVDLGEIRTWILTKLGLKQDTLVSGTNIKTINNASLLGSGNIDTTEVFIAKVDTTSAAEIIAAYEANKIIVVVPSGIISTYSFVVSNVNKASSTRCQIAGSYLNGMTFSNGLTIVKYDIDGTTWTFSSQNCQNKLVSGTNIKTINGTSLLGSGNIDIQGGGSDVFVATWNVTPVQDVIDAWNANKVIYLKDRYLRPCLVIRVFEEDVSGSSFQGGITVIHSSGEQPHEPGGLVWYGWANFIYDEVTEIYSWGSSIDFYELARLDVVTSQLALKQAKLVSGTNIKTINNTSLLGSGNIDIQGGSSDVFVAIRNVTPVQDVIDAWEAKKVVLLSYLDKTYVASYIRGHEDGYGSGGVYAHSFDIEGRPDCSFFGFDYNDLTDTYSWSSEYFDHFYLAKESDLSDYASITYVDSKTAQATADTLGTVKLNPNQNITLNANGQLEVGGRIGQFEGTTGLFAPNNRAPRNVLDYSFLMTDALGVDMSANRSMAVVSGYGLTCKSAAAGSTQYRISNTYANRIIAKLCEGGYASRDEATSKVEQIIPVVSVRIGGSSYTPNSSANDSSSAGDIIITTAETLNPNGAITSIRLFGKMQSYASLHLGNGIRSESGGRSVVLGGAVTKVGSTNDNCLIGNAIYSSGNGNAAFGRNHICIKNRGFFAGTGHDSTNARTEGASAVGEYSYMDSNTAFAVGNGTSHTARSNAFEVTSDGGIVLKSPDGTRYKVTVDNSGNLTPTAL